MKYYYARVSTATQNLDWQVELFKGCRKFYYLIKQNMTHTIRKLHKESNLDDFIIT